MSVSKKAVILVDLDDTIECLLESWVKRLNDTYNTSVDVNSITEWDMALAFPDLSRDQIYEPLFDDEFWNTVQPKDHAQYYIKRLIDDGHKIKICTCTHYKTLEAKMDRVLFYYFDFLSWNDVIIAKDKQMINADFLIDDGYHNLIGGKYHGILMDMPHNRKHSDSELKENGITRVKNWAEAYEAITRIWNNKEADV